MTLRRLCKHRNVCIKDLDNCRSWSFVLPTLTTVNQLEVWYEACFEFCNTLNWLLLSYQNKRQTSALAQIFCIKCQMQKILIFLWSISKFKVETLFTILLMFQALTHVRDIDQRMQGILKNKNRTHGLPLSIEGHVHYLISEATSEKNLCQMYVGWAAYM